MKADLKEKADMCPSGKKGKQKHFLLPNMANKAIQQCEKSRTGFIMFRGLR